MSVDAPYVGEKDQPRTVLADRRALPRVLTMRTATELGVSRATVRHGVAAFGWRQMAHGVVLTRDEDPVRDDWAVLGLELAGPRAALSGWDATRVHGLGARTPPTSTVLVLDRDGRNRRYGPVLIRPTPRPFRSRLLPAEHPTLPFAPVVDAARAVADTSLFYRRLEPVRALVTTSIQRERCEPAALIRELEHCPRAGSRWFRRSLEDVVVNARSIAEAEAVDWLTRARVPAFELNVPILDPSGEVIAVVDVLWRALRAVAEIDSREFHFSEQDWKDTLARHNRLTRSGLAVEHHPPSDIRAKRRRWADELAGWLRFRAGEVGVPYVAGRGPVVPGPDGPPPVHLPLIKSG